MWLLPYSKAVRTRAAVRPTPKNPPRQPTAGQADHRSLSSGDPVGEVFIEKFVAFIHSPFITNLGPSFCPFYSTARSNNTQSVRQPPERYLNPLFLIGTLHAYQNEISLAFCLSAWFLSSPCLEHPLHLPTLSLIAQIPLSS